MAHPKVNKESVLESARRMSEEFNRTHKVIAHRYSIYEVTPAIHYSNGWDQDIPERHRKVSDYFDTLEEAEAWTEKMEPEPGNHFWIKKETLRESVERRWYSF